MVNHYYTLAKFHIVLNNLVVMVGYGLIYMCEVFNLVLTIYEALGENGSTWRRRSYKGIFAMIAFMTSF